MDYLENFYKEHAVLTSQLRTPAGIPTGVSTFDDYLLWKGLPKGDLSLLYGRPGAGSTSLWIQSALQVHKNKGWVAWINSDWELTPHYLLRNKLDLSKLLVVQRPQDNKSLFSILQEVITSGIFELIGCHLPETILKNHQLQKLKRLARIHRVALVLLTHVKQWGVNPLFSLIIDCARDFFTVRRALHRPTPFTIEAKQAMPLPLPIY